MGTSVRRTHNNAILIVRSVAISDSGTYSCQVSGLGSFSASLTVLGESAILSGYIRTCGEGGRGRERERERERESAILSGYLVRCQCVARRWPMVFTS